MPVAITAITLWASAMLVHRGRIDVAASLDTWIGELETHPLLAILPITGRIAAESLRLDESFPKDPADQNIRDWGKVPLI